MINYEKQKTININDNMLTHAASYMENGKSTYKHSKVSPEVIV